MRLALTLLSAALWWVLYSSLLALACAAVASAVLRGLERHAVVFNRVYLACLLWSLLGLALVAGIALHEQHLHPPFAALLLSGELRLGLVLDMLAGAWLLWRLVPRTDARRLRPGSACVAAAVTMALLFGIATSLA